MSDAEKQTYIDTEIAANSCFTVFSNEKNVKTLVNENKKLGTIIKNFFKSFINRIENALHILSETSREYKALQHDLEVQQKILDTFNTYLTEGQKNNTTEGGVKHSLTEVFDENSDFTENIYKVISMDSVCEMDGTEFAKGEKDLITQVTEFFDSIGNVAHSKYGDVVLNKTGAKSSLGHKMGRNKAIAFTAIPNVIEQGEIVDYHVNHKGREYDTAVFAAPITIKNEPFYMAVIVNVNKDSNEYYLHEVALQKNEDATPFKTGNSNNATPSGDTSSIFSLLKKLQNVKKNNSKFDSEGRKLSEGQAEFFKDSKVRDKDGNLLVVYHQTGSAFSVFNFENQSAGKFDSDLPVGIFLKETSEDIGLSGKNQMALYANITNPLEFNNREEAIQHWRDNVDGYSELYDELTNVDERFQNEYNAADILEDEIYKESFELYKKGDITNEEFKARLEETETKKVLNEWTSKSNSIRSELKQQINKYISNSEYDGVIVSEDEGSFGRKIKTYIAFNSNQVKNTDNLNPTENKDIRFSKQESFDVDDFDEEDYNYPTLNYKEYKHLKSEIMTNFPRVKNTVNSIYLSSTDSVYLYKMDNDYDIMVLSKKPISNVDNKEIENVNRDGKKLDSNDKTTGGRGYRYNKSNSQLPDDQRTTGNNDRRTGFQLQQERQSDERGYAETGIDDYSAEKINFSLKEPTPDYSLLDENEELNEISGNIVSMLQLTEKDGDIGAKSVKSVATQLRKTYKSTYTYSTLVSRLKGIYDYMSRSGADANMDYVMRTAKDIAIDICYNTEFRDTSISDKYSDLRNKIRLTTLNVSQEIKDGFENYETFRRGQFGKLRLSSKKGIAVEEFYEQLSNEEPVLFPSDVNGTEMLENIADFFQSTAPVYYNGAELQLVSEGLSIDELSNIIASDILQQYFNMDEVKSSENNVDDMGALRQQTSQNITNMYKEYSQQYGDELQNVIAELKEINKNALKKLTDDQIAALAKQKAHFERISKKGTERRNRSKLRASIRKQLNKI